jgi:hypothetical protein
MKLLTEEIKKKLSPLYANEEKSKEEIMVPLKFFSVHSNWTWYVTEGSLVCPNHAMVDCKEVECISRRWTDYLFFGLVDGAEEELGYFSLQELEENGVERDLYWKPKPLSECYRK